MQPNLEIQVEKQTEQKDKYIFSVMVKSGRTKTEHVVTVDKDYYQDLTDGEEPVKNLVKRSFKFLLDREPQSAILSEFDLNVINKYFSNYENEIKK